MGTTIIGFCVRFLDKQLIAFFTIRIIYTIWLLIFVIKSESKCCGISIVDIYKGNLMFTEEIWEQF